MNIKKRKIKKRYIVIIAVIGVLLISAVVFFQCTYLGYRMTVQYRNFTEVQTKVYLDNSYSGDRDDVISIINEAKGRVYDFWGNIESSPTIIISDNEETIARLGGDRDTTTMVLFRAYCYISVSKEYLNVDIVAHELTHAELHTKLYKGKLPKTLIPTWFDEGIATQNDDRKQYSEETWIKKTDNGSNIIELDEMDTASEFYERDAENRKFCYMISRHEVKSWIEKNGMDKLNELIDRVNAGENFYELYNLTK